VIEDRTSKILDIIRDITFGTRQDQTTGVRRTTKQ